jgi:hypothetical protein
MMQSRTMQSRTMQSRTITHDAKNAHTIFPLEMLLKFLSETAVEGRAEITYNDANGSWNAFYVARKLPPDTVLDLQAMVPLLLAALARKFKIVQCFHPTSGKLWCLCIKEESFRANISDRGFDFASKISFEHADALRAQVMSVVHAVHPQLA